MRSRFAVQGLKLPEANIFRAQHDSTHIPPCSAAFMRQWTWSSLVPVMACRLFGAKPLPAPMLAYIQLDSREHNSVKGRVRIRKSKSDEKWNDRFVNDAYGVILHRCCTSKLCSWKCQILHNRCAMKRERWVSYAFLRKLTHFKDFKCIFRYQRTQALVILLQHINKVGDFSY